MFQPLAALFNSVFVLAKINPGLSGGRF